MPTITATTVRLSAAEVGPENPFPALVGPESADVHDSEETYGAISSSYPYRLQDGYSRQRIERDLPVIVMESDRLRAEFLPELGGRLFSLVDKENGRELLHRNQIFQPANLALRDAWFAGGVEWNIGATGHHPLTCGPVFAARISDPRLGDGLRLYAWDRIREVSYAIDFWMPDDAAVLLAHVAITNPQAHDVPMYWWSNIAVPETDELRVISPATSAYRFGYKHGLGAIEIPLVDGRDVSFPVNAAHSVDYFFDLDQAARPWIAALDKDGAGLVQSSTSRLYGRKLFCWGRGGGGRRWQEFLSGPGGAYCEIQAGLARTQLERIPMPANERWEWTESYGLLQADPRRSHSESWQTAITEVESRLAALVPADVLLVLDRQASEASRQPVQEIISLGEGWGALERHRRQLAGEPALPDQFTPFPDASLSDDQEPWVRLLRDGIFGSAAVTSYVAGSDWAQRLADAPPTPAGLAHRGVLAWQADDHDHARRLWQQAGDDPIALRCLALTCLDPAEKADLYRTALGKSPDLVPLVREAVRALIDAGRAQEALQLATTTDDETGRLWVLALEAAMESGELDWAAAQMGSPPEVAGIREGELSLEELWFRMQERLAERSIGRALDEPERKRVRQDHPVPEVLDFRMAR